MQVYKRKGSPKWWITWYDQHGTRHRRSSGTTDKKLADALAAERQKEEFLEVHFGKKPELPFAEALLSYAKAQKRDHPKQFMAKARYRLDYLARKFRGFNVSDFTYGMVQEFVD